MASIFTVQVQALQAVPALQLVIPNAQWNKVRVLSPIWEVALVKSILQAELLI